MFFHQDQSTTTTVQTSKVIDASPVFYGWIIFVVGTIGTLMMGPSQTFTIGIFIDQFIAELEISRANISLIYGLATLSASLMLPLTGRLVDQYGSRFMVQVVALGLGGACIGMAGVQGAISLFIGILALRFLGFGSLQLVSNNLISQWFIRRRGFVMGLSGQSLAVALVVFPALTHYLMEQFGWRWAWIILGLAVWGVMLPLGRLFFRDNPEQYGLLPDGDSPPNVGVEPQVANEENWTLAEARRTGAFWLFAAALSTMTMMMASLVFHQVSLFAEQGLSQEIAIQAYQVMAVCSIVGNISLGRLLDKFSARLLLAMVLGWLMLALIYVQLMVTPFQAMVYAMLLGLVSGSFRVIDSVVWAKYFGRRYLGSIRGATMMSVVGATAFGPYLLGFSLDYLGSYGPVLTALLTLPMVICLLAPFVQRPVKSA